MTTWRRAGDGQGTGWRRLGDGLATGPRPVSVKAVTWTQELGSRIGPAAIRPELSGSTLLLVIVGAVLVVGLPGVWRLARLLVTLVHELGHAVVGVAVGRRFTGFVVRWDASGHAVTVGRSRGPGQVAMVWAGYAAPAVTAGLLAWVAGSGWGATVLFASLVVLVVAAPRIRSLLTLLVWLAVTGGTGALWWWRDDARQAGVLIGVALVLLVGGWRHVLAVAGRRTSDDDPSVLARLTHLPRFGWVGSFLLVHMGATWWVARSLVPALAT